MARKPKPGRPCYRVNRPDGGWGTFEWAAYPNKGKGASLVNTARNPTGPKPATRVRRLRVVAHRGQNGLYPPNRDVYLESCILPHPWETDLFQIAMPVDRVKDLVRWAESWCAFRVEYDPPDNMRAHFLRDEATQPTLFDDC